MALLSAPLTSEATELVKEIFLKACEENDLPKLRHSFPYIAVVNWRGDVGLSGLHFAAVLEYEELLEILLAQKGVDVNIKDDDGKTPLWWACLRGHENIVRRLCQVPGIEVNAKDDKGFTPLMIAVIKNKPTIVSVLREVDGLDWNIKHRDYLFRPLTVAVFMGSADILQTILSVPEPHLDLSVASPTLLWRLLSTMSVRDVSSCSVETGGWIPTGISRTLTDKLQ